MLKASTPIALVVLAMSAVLMTPGLAAAAEVETEIIDSGSVGCQHVILYVPPSWQPGARLCPP